MADAPKKPETTRPFTAISGGRDPNAKETTRPIPASDATAPTQQLGKTQPTRALPGGVRPPTATGPVRPVITKHGSPATRTGGTAPVRAATPDARKTGATEARRTGSHDTRRTGGYEPRRTGATEARRTGGHEARRTGVMKRPGDHSIYAEPMVTDAMRARRREIERKKRRALIEKLRTQAEMAEGWQRVWRTVGVVFLVLACSYGYWRIQHMYGNQWPLLAVWIMMSLLMLSAFAWIIWYMNRGDA